MKKPFFSIIIPNYNSPYLRRTLDSIVKQDFDNWEVIVVDNNSERDISGIIKQYNDNRIRLYLINNEGIIGKSRNFGIEKSKAEIICFCDSDDWWNKKKLSIIYKKLTTDNIDILYHNMEVVYKNKKRIRKKSSYYEKNFYLNCLKFGNPIFNSALVIKKKIIEKAGYVSLNIDKKGWLDFDLVLKSLSVTNKIYMIDDFLGYYWIGTTNYSTKSQIVENMYNFNKYYILNNRFFQKKCPWWSNSILIKNNYQNQNYKNALKLIKQTKCFKFMDFVKLAYFYTVCLFLLKIKNV